MSAAWQQLPLHGTTVSLFPLDRKREDEPRYAQAGCCPHGPFSQSSFAHLQARSLSEGPWGVKQAPTPGSPRRAAAELGTNVTASIPCLKPPIPTGPQFVPAERSPGSSPHRAGTRHATAWHVFPGLPKQPQKHNKQQQHTADSRQTFPSYFLPSSVCAFSPLPQGSCCHRKGTTILFFSARSLRHPSRSRGAEPPAVPGRRLLLGRSLAQLS